MSEGIQNSTGNDWDAMFERAVQLHTTGQTTEAGALFAAIVEHNPIHFPSLQRLAAIRRQEGHFEESLALLKQAIGCNPSSADAHNSLGNTLNSLGRSEEAVDQYRCALALRPDYPEAYVNLGNSLKGLNRVKEAAVCYSSAIGLRPQYAEAHSNLGIALLRLDRPQDALASFTAAIALDPGLNIAYSNLGAALSELDRHEEALPIFQRARQLEPDAPQPVFNEALARLALGDFEKAWEDYEARWVAVELKLKSRNFPQPLWDGETGIAGKTFLIHAEQGLGDMILLARYIPLVAQRGARLIVECYQPIQSLIAAIPGVSQVLIYGEDLPDFDIHAPFGSLPRAFKTTLQTIPDRVPYLPAPTHSPTIDDLDNTDDPRPRVGVCWAGNPEYPRDRHRSIPLAVFQRLFRVPNVRFVSLQQRLRPGDEQILANYDNIDLVTDRKGSTLADTAALISKLDLVITVDTAIGHLTGALGRPVWVLLAYFPYWVWLRNRSGNPWYPTAQLFRQPRMGDWESVVERVAETLKLAVSSRVAPASAVV
ncbi:MAG TPA: tetratricopeptide repeat-containing glycosyltransferase family protein [Bryobacteraceae bacterium]|jgi:Flp pilus assembly protein TadD|nr:tetratricopeptide repeat-containing glycosyltransferase family protein [Bryobacteraceae bacterium]